EGEKSSWWAEREPLLRVREELLPKIRVRRETKLHGRQEDLEALQAAWTKVKEGRGNTVFIEGEAGIGKTRLVDALVQALEPEEVHVLYGSYPPSGGMGGLSDAIIGKFGEANLASALEPYLTVTPSLVPAFAALVKHESPPTGVEPLSGDALQAVSVHLMRALAEERPLLWVVDDLHFAPQESRDFVLALARAVEGHRVLLIATARPGLPDEELAHLSRLDNFKRIALGRLGAREIVHLLADAFKSDALAERLAGKIGVKSDGVPFFIFEMIRGLKEGQFIRQQADGTYVQTQMITDIEVPSAVKDLIEGRMRGLSKDERGILDVAAVQGFEFDPALLARVREAQRIHVLETLAEIERRFGLVHGGAGICRFDQNQIQEVLYQGLMPDLRAEYHTLLAEAYAERCGDEPKGDDAVFLAKHHLRGSRPKDGAKHLVPALDFLEKSFRNEEAIGLGARGLEAPKLLQGAERVEVLLRKAQRHGLRGERQLARASLDEALGLADERGDPALGAKVRNALGGHLYGISDYAASQELIGESLALAREAKDKDLEGQAMNNLGLVFWSLGRTDEARAHFEKRLALAREIGNRRGEAATTGNLGLVFSNLGRTDEARAHFEKSLAVAREIGNREGEAIVTGNLGVVFEDLGRYAEAQEHHERHHALSREIGYRKGEACAAGNLGDVSWHLGRHAEAQEHHERHRAISREIGDREGEGYALDGLAGLTEADEDAAGASRLYEEALALRRELGEKGRVAETLVALGRHEAAHSETESAATHLEEALALAQETTSPETILSATVERARLPDGDVKAALAALAEHEERVGHDRRMEARFRLWELTQDPTHLTEAHRLLAHLRDHAPEDCRDSMIENVPLHRGIMKAWEEHRGD
ncbi:MAG: tetratricopeptide repeat protein, partial [Planctomycetota bacterium]|nr:tetratricopeptide repeat protein [Planctomycetota bacterium]